jgi:hypothetical protein
MDHTYNGWTNKPTWLINLHFGDEEETLHDLVRGTPTEKHVADRLQAYVAEYVENSHNTDHFSQDLFNWALAQVNWGELAEAYLETYRDENED